MTNQGDVRLGDLWFRLAANEQFFAQTGLRPMRRPWRGLFAERQGVQGNPGVANVREDDLRWLQERWTGGEGQRVVDPGDASSFARFESSTGLNQRNPGELRLAPELAQQGLTGAGPVTVEGSTYVDDVGSSTVQGSDRILNAVGDRIRHDITGLTDGTYQIDFHAYLEPAPLIEGNTFSKVQGPAVVNGSDYRMTGDGATLEKKNQDPIDGSVSLLFSGTIDNTGNNLHAHVRIRVQVIDHDNDNVIVGATLEVTAQGGAIKGWAQALNWTAQSGRTYDYRVKLLEKEGAAWVSLDSVRVEENDTKSLLWEIRDTGATVFASGTVQFVGNELTTRKVATATITVTGGPVTRRLRITRSAGASRKIIVDKSVHTAVALDDPRTIELGQADRMWLVDFASGAAPSLLVYDEANNEWDAVGNFGPSGAKAIAMAHSDSYEFVALDDRIVYRGQLPSTAQQYTAATSEQIAGIAVGGNRLLIVTQSQANGSQVFSVELEGTPNVALGAAVYVVGNKGVSAPDPDLPNRVVGTASGCQFVVNQGPDCWVYEWDGSAGAPLAQLPRGFRGRALAHWSGNTWVGGDFPATDATGATRRRPSLWVVGSDGVPTEVDVRLFRDADPSTHIVAMQLYGSDLLIQTEVAAVGTTNKRMRVWRVSLRPPVAAFCEHEIVTDEGQASAGAGGIATNHRNLVAIWRKGNPYITLDSFPTIGRHSLFSSRYAYGMAEEKHLLEINVDGLFPEGTSAEFYFALDGGDFVFAGALAAPGPLAIETVEQPAPFTHLQIECRLLTTDPAETPVIYSFDPVAHSQLHRKDWELVLACLDESSVWNTDGKQRRGSDGIAHVYSLAEGGPVEFEDAYSSRVTADRVVRTVWLHNPDAFFIRPGEALVRVMLHEHA